MIINKNYSSDYNRNESYKKKVRFFLNKEKRYFIKISKERNRERENPDLG